LPADDLLAAQRSELLAQVLAAQYGLESSLASLAAAGAQTDEALSQMQALGDLQKQIASATPTSLTFLRGDVASVAAACRTLAQEARAAGLSERHSESPSARARATIRRLAGDLFERRVLDPYLQFASPEEEDAYRERERTRRDAIERALARGTPEGQREATRLTSDQLRDAGQHGATASPDFSRMQREADAARAALDAVAPNQEQVDRRSETASTADALDDVVAALRAAGVETLETADAGQRFSAAGTPTVESPAARSGRMT